MSVSEWNLPIERGGIKSSRSANTRSRRSDRARGPCAIGKLAQQAGLKTVAEDAVQQHLRNRQRSPICR